MNQEQLKKAAAWLHKKGQYTPVVEVRERGYAEFIAYVYRIHRENKPTLWFCVDMVSQWEIKQIKRICYGK